MPGSLAAVAIAMDFSVTLVHVTRDGVPEGVIGTELLIIGVYICIIPVGTQSRSTLITPKLKQCSQYK